MNKYQRSGKNMITGTLNRENGEEKVIKKKQNKTKSANRQGK